MDVVASSVLQLLHQMKHWIDYLRLLFEHELNTCGGIGSVMHLIKLLKNTGIELLAACIQKICD